MKTKECMKKNRSLFVSGEYDIRISGTNMIRIPRKWRRLMEGPLYCAYCRDNDIPFLRFFYNRTDMDAYKHETEDEGITVLSCSVHRIVPLIGLCCLPETFLLQKEKNIVLAGIGNGFELWRNSDWITDQTEELLESFPGEFK